MQRSPNEGITRALARQIAQREQLKALVAGSITSLGRHYVVGLEAVNAESGDVMAREQVEVASKEEVLTSLGAAASRLRRKLGESLGVNPALRRAAAAGHDSLARSAAGVRAGTRSRSHQPSVSSRFRTSNGPSSSIRTSRSRWRSCPARTPTPGSRRSRRSGRAGPSNCGTASANANGISSRGGTTAMPRRRGTRRSSWREPGRPRIRENRSRSTASGPRRGRSDSISRRSRRFGNPYDSIPSSSRRRLNLVATLTALNQFDEAKQSARRRARRRRRSHRASRRRPTSWPSSHNDTTRMARELDAALAKPEGAVGVQLAAAHIGLRRPHRESARGVSPERRGDERGER